ncbi:MAG: hypothetical protein U1D30_13460 [Planctomycetota bacterium]
MPSSPGGLGGFLAQVEWRIEDGSRGGMEGFMVLRRFQTWMLGMGLLFLFPVGCSPKAKLRDDPFLPGSRSPRTNVPTAPPPSDPFQSANLRAQERDSAMDVSTSPTTDPFYARDKVERRPAVPASGGTADRASAGVGNASAIADSGGNGATDEYRQVRQRLDKTGAKNIRSEKDEQSGEYHFHCEIPHPKDPAVSRVFEASHAEELKAMTAVTESAERWAAEQQ